MPALYSTKSKFPSLWALSRLLFSYLMVFNLFFGASGIQLIALYVIAVVVPSKVSIYTKL